MNISFSYGWSIFLIHPNSALKKKMAGGIIHQRLINFFLVLLLPAFYFTFHSFSSTSKNDW